MADFKRPSYTRVPNDIIRNAKLDPYDLSLYVVLNSFHPSHPSYKKIQEMTGMGMTRIAKSIKSLTEKGLISYHRGNSRKFANQYTVFQGLPSTTPGAGVVSMNHSRSESGTTPGGGGQPLPEAVPNKTKEIILKNKGDLFKMVRAVAAKKAFEPETN